MTTIKVRSWRKSVRSGGSDSNCVEVGCVHDAAWRKSSRSIYTNTHCVEVADVSETVAIRDSKVSSGDDFPLLTVSREGWTGLLTAIKHDNLND